MAISQEIRWEDAGNLYLDPRNPRLGRRRIEQGLDQEQILSWMVAEGVLEELAVSFLESGFWTQEALVAVKEKLGRKNELVVVEGNRRLAALRMLFKARDGDKVSKKWEEIASTGSHKRLTELERVPYVLAGSRDEVQSYLGFRHVSGIKEWNPAEKAQFIAHLIDDQQLSYQQVMRRIGGKIPTVRQNYISYRILLQMEDQSDDISIEKVEDRFSVLFLSLRTTGVQRYLQIDLLAEPNKAQRPVPRSKLKELTRFACWLFGTEENAPVVKDSRQVDKFGEILESPDAVEYLERNPQPLFETAYRIAGGAEIETANHVARAADAVEEALKTVHLYKRSQKLKKEVRRLGRDVQQLLAVFPRIAREIDAEAEEE